MRCQQQQLSGYVLFLFLTSPMIPSPNSSKWKKASRGCALSVVAVCARKNFDLDYAGTSSTNALGITHKEHPGVCKTCWNNRKVLVADIHKVLYPPFCPQVSAFDTTSLCLYVDVLYGQTSIGKKTSWTVVEPHIISGNDARLHLILTDTIKGLHTVLYDQ